VRPCLKKERKKERKTERERERERKEKALQLHFHCSLTEI
jgi:hypothetical protein